MSGLKPLSHFFLLSLQAQATLQRSQATQGPSSPITSPRAPAQTCAALRGGNEPIPSPGAAGPRWGDCPPKPRHSTLSGGTYLRMSLQNSRAVRGQPLFSRNIRCLKRARKKALHGEQRQDLRGQMWKEAFCAKGDTVTTSSSPASITSWCGTGCHRPPMIPSLVSVIFLCKNRDSKLMTCSGDQDQDK